MVTAFGVLDDDVGPVDDAAPDNDCDAPLEAEPELRYLYFRARISSKLKSSAGCIILDAALPEVAVFVVGGALIVALLCGKRLK